jgi:hypothetical protein
VYDDRQAYPEGTVRDLFSGEPSVPNAPAPYASNNERARQLDALQRSRERMYMPTMIGPNGEPQYDERWQYTGFEGMDPGAVDPEGGFNPDTEMPQEAAPQGERAIGLRQVRTPLDRLPLSQRRAAEQTTLQRRAEDSANAPALLIDQQAQEARNREQQIAALQADKAGLEGWLASAEAARVNNAGPAPARIKYARDALARIEAELAALAPASPEPNVTSVEPAEDIEAQIDAMLDPNTTKDSVWVSKGTPMPKRKLPGVKKVVTKAGTLLTTNPEKASALEADKGRASDEAFIKELLDLPASKQEIVASGEPVSAVTARTEDGAVAAQALANQSNVPETVANVKAQAGPEANVTVENPEAPMADRTRRARSGTKRETTPSRQPTPDQTAGAVTVEVAPGRPPEERRRIITEMLAPLQRKIASKTAGKSEKAAAQAEADQLLAQLDALDAATQTGGRSPSKGSVQEGTDADTGRERAGDPASRSPEAEAEEVLSRAEEDLVAIAREFDSALDDDAGTDPDFDVAPTAAPAELKVEGADSAVLRAAEMTVEVEGGESQVKPSAILDWYRKRIENLNLLKACLLK